MVMHEKQTSIGKWHGFKCPLNVNSLKGDVVMIVLANCNGVLGVLKLL